ncbi:MAG: hypothetical protein GPJ51_07165 [Candidatus Heimdallarchaeota archaeon]|nr:hypothetical protein [Candidatus Heimdallarchaeota archaeon]
MSLHCPVCEERVKIPKKRRGKFFLGPYVSTKYCSIRCQFSNYRYFLISFGLFFLGAYLAIGLPLYRNDPDLWWLFIIMFSLPFIGLIGLIGVFITPSIYRRIKKKLRERRFYCFFCGYDITSSSKEGSLLCNSCGNKVIFCNLCFKIVNPQEEIAVIKPCNHAFHKGELLDHVDESNTCPRCKGEIKELSFKLDKTD